MSLKIISFGEALFDLYESKEEKASLELNAYNGGAPMNFICACSKFGAEQCVFYTNLTDSSFSKKLREILSKYKIKIRTRRKASEPPAAVVLENGDFNFFITPSSLSFSSRAFKRRDFKKSDLFNFGSLFLVTSEGYRATRRAVAKSKKEKLKISFDINYRPAILKQLEIKEKTYFKKVDRMIHHADFIKFAEEEAVHIFGTTRTKKLFKIFSNHKNRNKLFIMTRGIKGADVFYKGQVYSQAAFKADKVVDTTGAGDIFFAGFLTNILKNSNSVYTAENIKNALEFASKVASQSVQFKGSTTALEQMEI